MENAPWSVQAVGDLLTRAKPHRILEVRVQFRKGSWIQRRRVRNEEEEEQERHTGRTVELPMR